MGVGMNGWGTRRPGELPEDVWRRRSRRVWVDVTLVVVGVLMIILIMSVLVHSADSQPVEYGPLPSEHLVLDPTAASVSP
jgi:hypothetical protein